MTIDDKIRDQKLQHDINRVAAKVLSSGKIDKYEYLTGGEILTWFYSPLGKALENN